MSEPTAAEPIATDLPTVQEAVNRVMRDVLSVSKDSRNTQQNFNFRGIDAVVNAVGPALRNHGVIITPVGVPTHEIVEVKTSKGSLMASCRVIVIYQVIGPRGDSFTAAAAGEAFDSGDKATPKAMSVAWRVMLLQLLCIPTDDPEVDAESHTRVARSESEGGAPAPAPVFPQEQVDAILASLRTAKGVMDDSARLLSIHEILSGAAPGLLDQVVTVSGSPMTIKRLADSIATGALV